MRILRLLLFAALVTICTSQTLQMQCSTNQRQTAVEMQNANVILTGIFPIHKEKTSGYGCGDFDEDIMQIYEAARWSLNYINLRNLAGNGLKLGMQAWDNCYSAERAVNDVLNFYPEDIAQDKFCNASNSVITMGVLGPYTSWSSKAVADLLNKYPASQISYGAANSKLSDKAFYPYFMRTAPSSGTYATNLLSLLRALKWNHLVAIFTDDAYGMNSFEEFLRISQNTEICISQAVLIDTGDSVSQIQKKMAQIVQTKASIGLIFAPSYRAIAIMDALDKRGDAGHLQWILNDLTIEKSNKNRYLKGALLLNPKSIPITEFVNHWVNLNPNAPPSENPWYREWFMTKYDCKLPGSVPAKFQALKFCFVPPKSKRRSTFKQNAYVEPVVLAMFAFARAMNSAHLDRCFGQVGVCQALLSMSAEEFHQNYLMKVDYDVPVYQNRKVKFDSNGDLENPEFRLWNYIYDSSIGGERFIEAGSSQNDVWTLNKLTLYDQNRNFDISANLTSQCPTSGCPTCLVYYQRPYLNFIGGDILIGGLFSAHDSGRLPFTCGPLNLQNVQAMIAFRFAIEKIKKQFPKILPAVSLGAVYSDVCQSSTLVESTLSGFLGEKQAFRDRVTNDLIEPNLIQAYVSSLENKQSIVASKLLGEFKYPEVEATATTVELSDQEVYPYFSRTVPGEGDQLMILSRVLKRKGWTYIQVVSNNYPSVEALKKYAKSLSVCVSAVHMIDSTAPDYSEIVRGLKTNPNARAVVVIGSPEEVNKLLAALSKQNAFKDFVLLGTNSWGISSRAVANQGAAADGSITLTADTGSVNDFKQYLDQLDPKSDALLTEWYQKLFDCYLYAGAQGSYAKMCSTNKFTSSSKFVLDKSVYYTINAVYAVVLALNNTINHYCGINKGACVAFRASRYDTGSIILKSIRDATIMDANKMPFVIKNGEGQSNFLIHNYRKNNGYNKIGIYNVANNLLQLNPASSVTSVCPGTCYECHQVNKKNYLYTRSQLTIAAILGIHRPASLASPFLCGDQINDYQFVTALEYAIYSINSGQAPVGLNGIRLGSLILDSCNLDTRAYGLMSAVYSGSYQVTEKFRPSQIVAWMTDTSGAASQMGYLASKLKVPLVSPSATSQSLMDRSKYSTFYRTIPGDESLSNTIAKLCRIMNFRYIQTIASSDQFSLESASMLKDLGKQEGVCVIASFQIGTGTKMEDILKSARQNEAPVVLFVSHNELEELLKVKKVPQDNNLILITPNTVTEIAKKYPSAAQNLLSTQILSSVDLKPYLAYMASQRPNDVSFTHVFFEKFYQDMFKCDLPGWQKYGQRCPTPLRPITDSPHFSPSVSVGPTINGVYAVVDALHDTLRELCGVNYSSICSAFYASNKQPELLLKNLDKANIPKSSSRADFRFVNREGSATYEILRFNGNVYQKVGSYDGVAMKMDDVSAFYKGVKTDFQKKYPSCQKQNVNFTLSPGDIYIAGVFDIHNQGLRLFSCGDIKMLRGYQNLEAFQFAIDLVNKKQGQFKDILSGVTLGGIGLDSCSSYVRAGNLVSNINNGLVKIAKHSVSVNPNEIFAYIGGPTSDSSIYLSRILRTLRLPLISYAATSVQLADQNRYPYFLRTVPADDKLVNAMTNFLIRNDIRYVQVVYTANNYGIRGSEVFNETAKEKRICVGQTIQFSDKGISLSDSANNVVTSLLEKPLANAIVIFAEPLYINALLKAINREPLAVQRKYKFVGASLWGKTWDAVRNVENIAEDSVSMAISNDDIYEFNEYLKSKTLENHAQNPWFSEFYERIFNCYLTEKKGNLFRPCWSTTQSVVSTREYVQDDSVPNVINSVFATAIALDQTLKQVCGVNYTGVCTAFKGQQAIGKRLFENLKNVSFVDLSSKVFKFTDEGDGNEGYTFYQLQKVQPTGYRYQEVATANSYGVLDTKVPIANWPANCDRLGACSECTLLRNLYPRFMAWPLGTATSAKPTIVGMFNIHSKGRNTFQCGNLDIHGDFTSMLAFFYGIEQIKSMSVVGVVLDICGHSLQVDQDVYSILSSGSLCHDDLFKKQVTANAGNIYTFLTMHDENTIAANRVLRSQNIAYLSPDATSLRLLTDSSFENLYRSTGTQSKRVETLIKLLKAKDIKNTVVFFSPNDGYLFQLNAFLKSMERENICVEKAVSVGDSLLLSNTIQTMSATKGHKVIVLLTNQSDAETVLYSMEAASPSPKTRDYIILGAEDWMLAMADKFASLALMVITATPRLAVVDGFSDFVKRLKYNNQMGIPKGWFDEFYEKIHKCRLPSYDLPPNSKICTQNETISDDMLNLTSPIVLKTVLGTVALTNAIERMTTQCKSSQSLECQLERPEGREKFKTILNSTSFYISKKVMTNPNLDYFYFTDRMWEPKYVLQELRKSDKSYKFHDIKLNEDLKSIDNKNVEILVASCQNCQCANDVKISTSAFSNGNAGTAQSSVSFISLGDFTARIRNYFHYEYNKRIYDWSLWAIIVAGFTTVGIIVTLILFFYLLIAYPIRGGTTPLGFIFIIGIMGIYGVNFAFFVPASVVTCAARRFCMGVVYAICFACLLVKAVDNWRTGDTNYDKKRYKRLSSSLCLVLIAVAIILMQVIIPVEWLLLVKPSSVNLLSVNPSANLYQEHDFSWCTPVGSYDSGLALSFIFIIILDLITILFGALAWDSEKNSFESRWIVIACLCTSGCFLVWMVVSTLANPVFRDPAVAIGNFVNATALLIVIPFRKVVLLVMAKRNEKMYPTDMSNIDDIYHRPASYIEPVYLEKNSWNNSGI